MKKILLLLIVACAAISVNAQLYVGGTVGYLNSKNKDLDYKTTQFHFSPEAGYTLNDKWAIGTIISFHSNKWGDAKQNYFSINPYGRYTFYRNNLLSLFAEGGPTLQILNETGDDSDTAFGLGIRPGITIRLTDKISVLARCGNLGYSESDETRSFSFTLSNSLSFGLFYSF